MRKMSVKTRGGSYFLRKTFNGEDYSKSWGEVGNDEDYAYMLSVAAQANRECSRGTFEGFDKWFKQADRVNKDDLIKLLTPPRNDVEKTMLRRLEAYRRNINSPSSAETFFDTIEASEPSRRRYLSVLKRIAPTLFGHITAPKGSKGSPDPFRIHETKKLLEAAYDTKSPVPGTVLEFWLTTGLRNGELQALTKEDLDIDGEVVTVFKSMRRDGVVKCTKTGTKRMVRCPGFLLAKLAMCMSLNESLNNQEYYPLRSFGTCEWLRSKWKPLLKKAGLRYRKPYCIRHTAISRKLVEYKGDIARVGREMGNSPAVIAAHYAGVLDSLKD
ncbi:hypothetical protein [Sphaerothrix gracilis]|uniref:hypothetical protein n=1 Tax=Sphaerothrix gracilis TaxID=3151835 RepID=UPI0031FC80C7